MELLFFVYLKPRYDMIFVVMNFRKEHVMYHYMYHYGSPAGMVLPTVYLLIFAGALFVAAVEYIFLEWVCIVWRQIETILLRGWHLFHLQELI